MGGFLPFSGAALITKAFGGGGGKRRRCGGRNVDREMMSRMNKQLKRQELQLERAQEELRRSRQNWGGGPRRITRYDDYDDGWYRPKRKRRPQWGGIVAGEHKLARQAAKDAIVQQALLRKTR
ncbi:Hypothetical predicted protein [Paramuricea clavata]|uniref:Uncharacterized protein n=1 Tax=Paramuricea clavata TaxID=317549 RepID=A0A6S7FQ19_PARCT|nr:Hypothetical predicted protein [Paramuricea clavata]